MHDDILQPFRQPLVTSIGILLGFTLTVAANWVRKAFTSDRFAEYILALGPFLHIPLYLIVLYRNLNINYPRDKYVSFYKKTLVLFISGVTIDFLSIVIIRIEGFIKNRL